MEPVAVTIDGARAALGGVGLTYIYGLIKEGKLEAVKVGGRRLVKVSSIRRLVGEEAA
ncbi:MAG: excisionase family DNA-binding protein [Pseudomonadota bacterium]|nr:excisionase family DNA-binding protein [Pseudomonadota bacterium]